MNNDERWSVYIDIEGFGALYPKEDTILLALGDLMEGIYLAGCNFFPQSPDRIFAHQTGDGFIIVGEFGSPMLETPVALAIALLRHVVRRGRFAKAAIAEGTLAGINGCYPQIIQDAQAGTGRDVFMGDGLLTVFPVMGTALINAISIEKRSPSGALLTVAARDVGRLPIGCIWRLTDDENVASIDWVHSDFQMIYSIQSSADLSAPSTQDLVAAFASYFKSAELPMKWKIMTNEYLSLGLLQ